jgi:hypothetical protein
LLVQVSGTSVVAHAVMKLAIAKKSTLPRTIIATS